MNSKIQDVWLQLQDTVPELDGSQGCFIDSHVVYFIDNNGVLAEQIAQWLIVVILPVTTLIFIFAGVQANRTHGCSFDSLVLFASGFYNLLFMSTELVYCNAAAQLLRILYVTAMILYLYYSFEQVLNAMDSDMQELRENKDPSGLANTLSLTSPLLRA
jgi:hypothetical protein